MTEIIVFHIKLHRKAIISKIIGRRGLTATSQDILAARASSMIFFTKISITKTRKAFQSHR